MKKIHELEEFAPCTFGDGGHYYAEGFDRAVCTCGWKSAPSDDHKDLIELFEHHRERKERE